MTSNDLVQTILGECESIISCVENVQDMCEGNTLVVQLLSVEDFEQIRYDAEELQTLVVQNASNEDLENQSITLYQSIKYTLEALEESIQDADILNEFSYIRAAVYVIRDTI